MIVNPYSGKHIILIPLVFLSIFIPMTLLSQNLKTNPLLLFLSVPGHLMLIVYVALVLGKENHPIKEFHLSINVKDILIGILSGLGIFLFTTVLSTLLPLEGQTNQSIVFNHMGPVLLAYMIFTGVLAPFIEEIVFRGFFWKILERKQIHKGLILMITSALFALMHFDLYRLIPLFMGGLFYGLLRMRSKSLNRAVTAHITNNFTIVLLTLIIPLILKKP